jgi:hypothetical protein
VFQIYLDYLRTLACTDDTKLFCQPTDYLPTAFTSTAKCQVDLRNDIMR